MENTFENYSKVQLEAFLSRKRILLVDSQENSRKATAQILESLGANPKHIIVASDYVAACGLIHQARPDIVITEYWINKGNGISLAGEFNRVKLVSSIFVILTENSLQSVVSAAAEEDVDLYVLKPYLTSYFIKVFTRVVYSKLNPSIYSKQINQGKKHLANQSWDEAILWFNNAIRTSAKPSLAYYYRSRGEIEKFLYDVAEKSLQSGLKYNEHHYKCLIGLFDLLVLQGKLQETYPVVKRLINFPLSSKRLSKVIELAVKTARYSELDKYYDAFMDIKVKDNELEKYMSAALVVSSKKLFQKGEMLKAASYLKKASVSAAGRTNILLEIVATLALNGFFKHARDALDRFSADSHNSVHYKVACAIVLFFEEPGTNKHLELLQKAIDEGIAQQECFYWIIAFLHANQKNELVEKYMSRAKKIWPDKEDYFQKALRAIPKKLTDSTNVI